MTDTATATPAAAASAMLGGDAPAQTPPAATPAAQVPATTGEVKPSENHDKPLGTWQPPDWAKDLPPEDLGYLEKKRLEDPKQLYKSYREAERALNDGRIALPKDDAPPEEIDKFYSKLGRPDSPDKYVPPKDADPAMFKALAPELHAAGLNQKQLEKVADGYNKFAQAQMAQLNDTWVKDINESQARLEKEWGNETPKEIELNKRAMRALGISVNEGAEYMTKGAEKFLRLLNLAGRAIAEDNSGDIQSDSVLGFGLTANRAGMELAELRSNKDFMARVYSGDSAAKAKYNRLVQATAEAGQIRNTVRSGFKPVPGA